MYTGSAPSVIISFSNFRPSSVKAGAKNDSMPSQSGPRFARPENQCFRSEPTMSSRARLSFLPFLIRALNHLLKNLPTTTVVSLKC